MHHVIHRRPGWTFPDAVVDLDLANYRFWGAPVALGATSSGTTGTQGSILQGSSNSIVQYAPIAEDPTRVLKAFLANELRVTKGYGLWADGIRTNSCLQSRDLTSASWTKTGCTAARTTGADGIASGGSTVTATGANATCLQAVAVPARFNSYTGASIATAGTGYTANDTITVSGGTGTAASIKVASVSGGVPQTLLVTQGSVGVNPGNYTVLPTGPAATTGGTGTGLTLNLSFTTTFSAYVKRVTGTGTVNMSYDGSTWVDVTGQLSTSSYTLVSLPVSTTFAGGTPGFRLVTSGDAIAVDFCQVENRAYPTQPLVTTTTNVTNTSDEPAISDPGGVRPGYGFPFIRSLICNGQPWSMLVIASGNTYGTPIFSDGGLSFSLGTTGNPCSFTANGQGSGLTGNAGTFGLGNVNRAAGRARGFGASCCLNGGAVVNGTGNALTAQVAAFTHIGMGNNGAGINATEGYIRRVAFWNRELTDGEMIEYTRADSSYGN